MPVKAWEYRLYGDGDLNRDESEAINALIRGDRVVGPDGTICKQGHLPPGRYTVESPLIIGPGECFHGAKSKITSFAKDYAIRVVGKKATLGAFDLTLHRPFRYVS